MVRDPDLPAAELLLGPDAVDALQAAVPRDAVVRQARPTFVDYSPGRHAYVGYEAWVEWPDRAGTETLAAVARSDGDVRGEPVEAAGTTIGVWAAPDDPYVPGLAAAHDVRFVHELLDGLGLGAGRITLEPLTYSPRSRAVVRVLREPVGRGLVFVPGGGIQSPAAEAVAYVKVMRRSSARDLRRAQSALDGLIPAPRCLAEVEDLALFVFEPMPGEPLYDCVLHEGHPAPDGHELFALLDRFRDVELPQEGRLTMTKAVRINARTMAAVMPSQRERLESFVERLGEDARQPEITIHGDFHEVQLLLGPQGLTGVLDLDDCGRGQRVDDLAMMLGRLYSFAATEPWGGERLRAYADALVGAWDQYVSPYELRRRIAGVAMNQALMPFRQQESGWPRGMADGIARADLMLRELERAAA